MKLYKIFFILFLNICLKVLSFDNTFLEKNNWSFLLNEEEGIYTLKLCINSTINDTNCLEMSFDNKKELDMKIFNKMAYFRDTLEEESKSIIMEIPNLLNEKDKNFEKKFMNLMSKIKQA